jgi:hypothetical protein
MPKALKLCSGFLVSVFFVMVFLLLLLSDAPLRPDVVDQAGGKRGGQAKQMGKPPLGAQRRSNVLFGFA